MTGSPNEDDETAADETDSRPPDPAGPAPDAFPVVGVGSSAGGLQAVSELVGELPSDPDFALVLVAHGDPEQESQLVELVDRASEPEVVEISDATRLLPGRVHVCPPGFLPEIEDGRLRPVSVERVGVSHTIDRFFRALSDAYRSQAIGVVLSGNLSDGAQGLQVIQQRGGIAIVQDPDTAQHRSMPDSAIEAETVDHVLPPAEIADKLVEICEQWDPPGAESSIPEDGVASIFDRVREVTGVDFAHYKSSTLVRRIHRRLIATGARNLDEYLQKLQEDTEEAWDLHDESLIHVTEFFRDPEVFEALREEVIPELVERRSDDEGAIRVWVPGCASGEEVYSLAMLLTEYLEEIGSSEAIQVFGTDLSERAIEAAREARYPATIEDHVSDERLQRFFTKEEGHYHVREPLRNACVFARQDLLNDPPLSGIDLVSCRNVLIYLRHDRQEEVANTLHYALEDDGVLVLGSSESVERFRDLFEPIDPEHNIYRAKETLEQPYPDARSILSQQARHPMREAEIRVEASEDDLQRQIDQTLLDLYAPPAIVLDEDLEIVEFRGDVSDYVDPHEGRASLNVMRIAPQGLVVAIRSALDEIQESGGPVYREPVRYQRSGQRHEIGLRIATVHPGGRQRRYYAVSFEEEVPAEGVEVGRGYGLLQRLGEGLVDLVEPSHGDESQRVHELEEELEATRAYLQTVIEEYEATNEELRSAHEEALSTNEELQSTNEELETAKEELQSTNEELTTVNDELRERNEQIEQINNDLVNLLEGVALPIVMLGSDLRIRRFTPEAGELLGLIEGDEGRPLDDLNLPFDDIDLKKQILEVLDSLSTHHAEIEHDDEGRYRLRITPYRTQDDKIDGAVLVFWNIRSDESPA